MPDGTGRWSGIIDKLLDKSVAIVVMAVAMYAGFRWHTRAMLEVFAYVKAENEYLRSEVNDKLTEILRLQQEAQRK